MRKERDKEQKVGWRATPHPQAARPVPLTRGWKELATYTARTPWLVQPLMRQGTDAVARVAQQYLQLRRLPRRVRRALEQRGALSLAGAALLLALADPEPGWAGTRSVGSADDLSNAILLFNAQTGAYAGTNTATLTADITVTSALDAVTSAIVISGNGHTITGGAGLTSSIFQVTSKGTFTLQDTTVTGGKGSKGGAIYNQGTLTLTDSTVTGNTVSSRGGALFNHKGTVVLSNSTVSKNSAGTAGGGVYNEGGRLTLTDSTVTDNHAKYGGGVDNIDSGTVVLSNSTVSKNSVSENGGGLLNDGGTVTVSNSTVSGNTAGEEAGGIQAHAGTVTVTDGSTVTGNHAKNGGGIFVKKDWTAVVQNSTISGNVATGNGGGIMVNYGGDARTTLKVTYSTISGNRAQFGGGINIDTYTSVSLENSTLSGNSASDSGGGLNVYSSSAGYALTRAHVTLSFCTLTGNTAADKGGGISTGQYTDLTLSDTLVSGNHAPTGREVRTNTHHSDISFGHNNIFGYSGSSGLDGKSAGGSDIVPSVALSAILDTTLADNGGDTETHALVSGSPAIDAASVDCPSPDLDQREYGRPASGSSVCDIGAFEYGATDAVATPSTLSALAQNVGTEQPNGTVKLAFSVVLAHALDLWRATARLHHVVAEGGVELVEGLEDLAFALQRQEGAKMTQASFATPADVQPKVRLQAQIKKGVLQVTVRVDQAVLAQPQLCSEGATELASELVLSDGQHPTVRVRLQELWACQTRRDGKVTGLELLTP